MITKQLYDSFWDNGYLIINNFYSKEEISDFSDELANLILVNCKKLGLDHSVLNDENIFDKGIEMLENVDHEHIASLYDTIFQMPSFFRICGKVSTQEVINTLLERSPRDPLYGFTNRCRIDPPQDNRRTYGF